MLRKLDNLLNGITMYKLLLYGLLSLATLCLLLSLLGTLTLPFGGMVLSLLVLAATCYAANEIMARTWKVPANSESWMVSALILFFVLPQATSISLTLGVALAGIVAMYSKYVFNWHGKHLFNPAALSVAVLGLAGLVHASWWIGSSLLWPVTLVFGLLVIRKVRRASMVAAFAIASIVTTIFVAIINGYDTSPLIANALTASPLIFLGTIMLTEPSTMPPARRQQIIFGTLVGVLYAGQFKLGSLFLYPEVALVIGNVYAFATSPKYRLKLRLESIEKISGQVYSYVFTPDRKLEFAAGQYMEWTLGHPRADIRGNRRTFTIASSPTEDEVRLGVKFYQPSSSFKRALHSLQPGGSIYAGQVAGNFTLPRDKSAKLVFIAGGIGITPFRSMAKFLTDTGEKRDITLYYLVSNADELAFTETLEQAAAIGLRYIPVVAGQLDSARITQDVPDYAGRKFYISGPQAMVLAQKKMLLGMGVKRSNIESDYFSGY